MHQFTVSDMTCGHCAGTIAKAVKSEDPTATIDISLRERVIKVGSQLSREEIARVIAEAGYTPTA